MVTHFLQHAHARLLTSVHADTARILLHAFREPPSVAAPPPNLHDIQETLQPFLAADDPWDVFADGSWYPESMLGKAASYTGGCSLIFAP